MYDTLLQMGRWFGYRPNYEDLFRIWMAEEAVDWYGYITRAANELKDEIGSMAMEIAGKVIEREISEKDHTKLIDEFISNVGNA